MCADSCTRTVPPPPALILSRPDLHPRPPPQAFAKLNCNKYNKELGMELKVRVAPTFHLYKNSVKVAEMTGAKIDVLRELVATHK